MKRRPGSQRHTGWCARDHRCNLGEHRSDEILVDLPGHARAVLVRVRASDGREHAEIRVRVALADVDPAARRQLGTLLAGLRDLVTRAAAIRRPCPGRTVA
ncbi:hypothetical protein C5N14_23695 [Micromonospora sp. MW-13]|uniref:hypothetical protein n=1 Tax=Micromonospora sp. MW-13 TaxID=2094022 RepID=UPI000E438467|nr:hypothetical protein [Micromonospora sp. MW-13]RGC66404.1 hypothetical protein C5N14_23695 [Micromonospora sp. MW-13]